MRPCTNADETDAYGPGRRALVWNHGARRKVKVRTRRRERRQARVALHRGETP